MFGIQEIDASQLATLLESDPEGVALVDVRGAAEMAQGMLPGARAVPMHLVPLRLDEWRNEKKIVFYCRSGVRSAQVCGFLKQQGIDHAVNLRGGIIDWYRQGYAIETPEAASLTG